ncbi:hypothetical protein [Clostridium tyrobutyricum]|nr:hypothetical protein [Clostridium tyrobutyricum]
MKKKILDLTSNLTNYQLEILLKKIRNGIIAIPNKSSKKLHKVL